MSIRGTYDSFESYMNMISQYPTLSSDEQKEIFKSISTLKNSSEDLLKKEELQKQLIQSNLLLVVSCAKKFDRNRQTGIPIMDLIAAGNRGLTKAVKYYDVYNKTNTNFCTYSYTAITRFIHQEFNEHSIIKIPRNHKINKSKILRNIQQEENISSELLNRMKITDSLAFKAIDEYLEDHLEDTRKDFMEEMCLNDLRRFLNSKIEILSDRQKQIVKLVYLSGEYRPPAEVASELGITRQAVFNHLNNSLKVLQAHMNVVDYKRQKVS